MELEPIGNDFQWNSSIRDSSSYSAQIKKRETNRKRPSLKESHTFVGSIWVWVCGFCLLGSWVRRLSSWVLLLGFIAGFVAWVHWLGLWVHRWVCCLGLPTGFVVDLLFVFVFLLLLLFLFFIFLLFFFQRETRKKKKRLRFFGFLLWNSSV